MSVDCCSSQLWQVVGDWDCMLNQTNIGQNNNKFYVIQMLQQGGKYRVWNRWGRVGEPGQNAMKGPFSSEEAAASDFCKKFKDKTKNSWEDRDNFVPVKGKYTLLEMDDEEGGEEVRERGREGGKVVYTSFLTLCRRCMRSCRRWMSRTPLPEWCGSAPWTSPPRASSSCSLTTTCSTVRCRAWR